MQIYLKKVDGGRVVVIDAESQIVVAKPAIYESNKVLIPGTKHMIMAGVAQDMGNNLRAIYTDSQGGNSFEVIQENSSFDFSPITILAFKNIPGFTGNVIASRMIILDSSFPAVNFANNNTSTNIITIP